MHADLQQTDISVEICLVHAGVCFYFGNRPFCLVWAKWCHLLGAAQLENGSASPKTLNNAKDKRDSTCGDFTVKWEHLVTQTECFKLL